MLRIELSSEKTMIGDLSGVMRALRDQSDQSDQRFIETTLFTKDQLGFAAPATMVIENTSVRREPWRPRVEAAKRRELWSPWEAAAIGFIGVLALAAPIALQVALQLALS